MENSVDYGVVLADPIREEAIDLPVYIDDPSHTDKGWAGRAVIRMVSSGGSTWVVRQPSGEYASIPGEYIDLLH